MLAAVEAATEFREKLPIRSVIDYLAEALDGRKAVDYFIGYKPAPFVAESDDELGVSVLTSDFVFEFVFGPHRRRYDVTALRSLAWFKLDERESVRLDGTFEPVVKFEARFAGTDVELLIEAAGEKAAQLKSFAKRFEHYLLTSRLDVGAGPA